MPLELVRQDITKMKVNAIVNAANTQLAMGGGVCGAIFRAAGVSRMAAACDRFAPIHTGEAVITPGFNLPSRYVIHTAGPIWRDGKHDEERLLRSCYRNSMELAARQGCASIAFPLISSGIDIRKPRPFMWPSMRFADSWATQPTPDTISTYTYAYSTKPLSK